MLVRDSTGVFTERLDVFEYMFEHDNSTVERVLVHLKPRPVLKMVHYVVRIGVKLTRVLDAQCLAWCEVFHGMHLPKPMPFRADPDYAYFQQCLATIPNLSQDFIGWARHDLTYHIKRLVPHTSPTKFKALVGDPLLGLEGYERLVREFAVDPTVLRRFLPDVEDRLHPLVEEAVVFAEFTARMIRYRKVWLSELQLGDLLTADGWWMERCRDMERRGLIVHRAGAVALGWAAAKLAEFAGAVVRVAPFVPPVQLAAGEFSADPRYPVDAFVHNRELACSMVDGLVPAPYDNPARVMGFAEACAFIRETLGTGKRTICFSESGDISFDVFPAVTVWHKTDKLHVVQVGGRAPQPGFINYRDASGLRAVASSTLYDSVQVISHERFSDLYRFPKDLDVDYVIALFSKGCDPGMYLEVERFSAKKIMIRV